MLYQLPHSLRHFAYEHDVLPAFHAAFFAVAVLSAALLNLGAFALLVIAHMSLDIVKYRERHGFSWHATLEGVFRESLTDVTLLLVGLVFSVYLHHTIGITSIAGLMRAELSLFRMVAVFIPKIGILHHFLKIVSHLHHYLDHLHPRHLQGLSRWDSVCMAFIGVSIALILFAAPLMGVDIATVAGVLLSELIPWRI